jgi:uncharacterized protein (TIGR03435 family)
MLRTLLADRFKLVVHTETREVDVYRLVVARTDGKLGPGLRPSAVDCEASTAAAANPGRSSGTPAPPPQRGQRPPCALFIAPGIIAGEGITMARLSTALGGRLGRTAVDGTELTVGFDFELRYTPDQMPQGPLSPGAPPIDPNGPSIFTALQEQLGLKLESTKGPVEVLVVDSVERPSPD